MLCRVVTRAKYFESPWECAIAADTEGGIGRCNDQRKLFVPAVLGVEMFSTDV